MQLLQCRYYKSLQPQIVAILSVIILKVFFSFSRFSFPSVFVVYSVIAGGVVEVCLLIGYTDRTSLFCSSRDLAQSAAKETQFCTAQGTYLRLYIHTPILSLQILHLNFLFKCAPFVATSYTRAIHVIRPNNIF